MVSYFKNNNERTKTMKSDKVIRQTDELGRVVIPRDMRRELGIECGDKIVFETEDNKIIITKQGKSCVFCNSRHELSTFCDKHVCAECLRMLKTVKD